MIFFIDSCIFYDFLSKHSERDIISFRTVKIDIFSRNCDMFPRLNSGERPQRGCSGLAILGGWLRYSQRGHESPITASKHSKGKIFPESARAKTKDDSPIDSSVKDCGTYLNLENGNFETGNISWMQICSCGWTKRTSIKGLRIH